MVSLSGCEVPPSNSGSSGNYGNSGSSGNYENYGNTQQTMGTSESEISDEQIINDLNSEVGFFSEMKTLFSSIGTLLSSSYNKPFSTNYNIAENDYANETGLSTIKYFDVNAVCANEDFSCDSSYLFAYRKSGESWIFESYDLLDRQTDRLTQIPEGKIKNDLIMEFANGDYSGDSGFTVHSINQTKNASDIGATITAQCTQKKGILTKTMNITAEYSYFNQWMLYIKQCDTTAQWDVQALAGKTWNDPNDYKVQKFFYIESVDPATSTVNIGYMIGLWSSTVDGPLEEHGKPIRCTYTTDDTCIKIQTPDTSIYIYPDLSTDRFDTIVYPD